MADMLRCVGLESGGRLAYYLSTPKHGAPFAHSGRQGNRRRRRIHPVDL